LCSRGKKKRGRKAERTQERRKKHQNTIIPERSRRKRLTREIQKGKGKREACEGWEKEGGRKERKRGGVPTKKLRRNCLGEKEKKINYKKEEQHR